ncbi:MAG: CBS domain-containing protein [Actinomycetota bacterium]|nr:CBS domain-containing protein [Actinomycetota bacterium]
MRSSVPTCRPHTLVSEASAAARAAGWDVCIVVNENGIVLGRLRGDQLDSTLQEPVEAVMELGPTTTRADDDLAGLVERMQRRNVGSILVTDPDGRLIGVLRREDGQAALSGR